MCGLRRVALGMLLGVMTLAGLTARVIVQGEAELRQSDAAFDRGDLRAEVHSVRAYAQRCALRARERPTWTAAYARLEAVALGAESSNQLDVARQAWGAIRGAALETRHPSTPREADLERANVNLARLSSPAGGGSDGRIQAAKMLARDDAPRAPWVLALGVGFCLFAAGLGPGRRKKGSPAAGRVSWRGLLVAGLVALSGVACWTLAVYRA